MKCIFFLSFTLTERHLSTYFPRKESHLLLFVLTEYQYAVGSDRTMFISTTTVCNYWEIYILFGLCSVNESAKSDTAVLITHGSLNENKGTT